MFDSSLFPSLPAAAAVLIPLLAALVIRFVPPPPGTERGRALMVAAGAAALAASCLSYTLQPLSWLAMVVFSAIAFLTFVASPQRDQTPEFQSGGLLILSGALAVYASGNLLLLVAGWILSAIPMWRKPDGARSWRWARAVLLLGMFALSAAVGLMAYDAAQVGNAAPLTIATLNNLRVIDSPWILGLLVIAVLSRKGIVPLHGALLVSCQQGSLLNTMLFMNSHLGVYLLARLAMPLMPVSAHQALVPLADLALLSAACTAVMALSEKNPRRLLGLLSISQMSFLLAGLESSSEAGLNGALTYWVLLSVSTCGMFLVLRSLEVRISGPLTLNEFRGLGSRAPRLAAFFLVCAVALIGLPGTLGFVAEDLLFHGTLESHPEVGIVLPIATALNAITLLRMFVYLFFGRRGTNVAHIPDALRRERWALTAAIASLVVLGLQPRFLLTVTDAAASALLR